MRVRDKHKTWLNDPTYRATYNELGKAFALPPVVEPAKDAVMREPGKPLQPRAIKRTKR
jgi:hypothetical protein